MGNLINELQLTSCTYDFITKNAMYMVMIYASNRAYIIYQDSLEHLVAGGSVPKGQLFSADLAKQLLIKHLTAKQ